MKVIIVGGGVVGLSIARSLRDRGHEVTLLDQGPIPNPNGASFDEHRMIRFQYNHAEGYARMVGDALAAWDRLWNVLGRRHFGNSGVLSVSMSPGDYADNSLQTLKRAGLPHEVVTGEALARLAPQLDLPPHAVGVLCRPGGGLYADRIVTDLANLLEASGARLLPHHRVVAVNDADGSVTTDDGGVLRADLVVVAAGAWLDLLLPDEYAPLPGWRQTLCYVRPPSEYAAAWADGPCLCVLGDKNVYTLPPLDGTGLKFGSGMLRQAGAPAQGFQPNMSQAQGTVGVFSPYLRRPEGYEIVRGKVGYYVADDVRQFKLQRKNRRLVVTNCDGQMFKFGALLGERIAGMIDGETSFEATARWFAGRLPDDRG